MAVWFRRRFVSEIGFADKSEAHFWDVIFGGKPATGKVDLKIRLDEATNPTMNTNGLDPWHFTGAPVVGTD